MRSLLFGLFVGGFCVAILPVHWNGAKLMLVLGGTLLVTSGLVRLTYKCKHRGPADSTKGLLRFLLGAGFGGAFLVLALNGVAVADAQQLACAAEKRLLRVQVVGLPAALREGHRFDAQVIDTPAEVPQCGGLRGQRIRFSAMTLLPIRPGQQLVLEARLRTVRGVVSAGAFDVELHALRRGWLFRARVARLISVRESVTFWSQNWTLNLRAWLDRHRLRLRERLLAGPYEFADVLTALAVGDGSVLQPARWRLVQDSGTAHLLVISGLHVGLVGGLLLVLLRLPTGALVVLARRLAGVRISVRGLLWLGWMALVGMYVGVVGAGVPAVRAGLMGAAVLSVWLLRRCLDRGIALFIALIGVCAVQPLAAYEAGFWLSFVLVSWLLLKAFEGREANLGGGRRALMTLMQALRFNALCTFVLLPLFVLFGLPLAVSAPIANLVAVPLVSLLIVPLVLLGALLNGAFSVAASQIFTGADRLLWGLFEFLSVVQAHLPALLVTPVHTGHLVLSGLFLFVCLFSTHRFARLAFLAGLMGILAGALTPQRDLADQLPEGEFALEFLDVGQGLAVLIRTARHTFLYDTGASSPAGYNFVDAVVAPGLAELGRQALTGLIISHADNDHAGGVARVRDRWEPEYLAGWPVIESAPDAARRDDCVWQRAEGAANRGQTPMQRLRVDAVELRLLHDEGARSRNDRSCVLVISSDSAVAVLTGDIGVDTEQVLLPDLPANVAIMSVPHHGSLSSSSALLLARLSPAIAVVSAGAENRFGHPRPEVVRRYQRIGAHVLSTAEEGTVSWQSRDPTLFRSARAERLRRLQLGAPLLLRRAVLLSPHAESGVAQLSPQAAESSFAVP